MNATPTARATGAPIRAPVTVPIVPRSALPSTITATPSASRGPHASQPDA